MPLVASQQIFRVFPRLNGCQNVEPLRLEVGCSEFDVQCSFGIGFGLVASPQAGLFGGFLGWLAGGPAPPAFPSHSPKNLFFRGPLPARFRPLLFVTRLLSP